MKGIVNRIARLEAQRPPAKPVAPGLDESDADDVPQAGVLHELVHGLRGLSLEIAGAGDVQHRGSTQWSINGRYWHRIAERASAALQDQCFVPLTRAEMVEAIAMLETGWLEVRAGSGAPFVWPDWRRMPREEHYAVAQALQHALNAYTAQTGSTLAPDTESVVEWLSELLEYFDEEHRWIK